jgi:structural maintenance of chromosome 3 (chondroitin sulfate proteoglycan 6)
MIERIKFEEKFRPAFMQIFGKMMIVRDIQTGLTLSRNNDLDCITLDGDQVNRKGAMTGGFVDSRNSRLKLMHKLLVSFFWWYNFLNI